MRKGGFVALAVWTMAATASAGAEGPVRRFDTWAVLGPFTPSEGTGHDEDFLGGEAKAAPRLDGETAGRTWLYFDDRLYCRNQDDYNDLYTFYMEGREGSPGGGTDHRVAYCGGYLWSAEERPAVLRFSANDTAKVWIGGQLVLEQRESKEAMRDTEIAEVTIPAGWTPVLVKVANERRIWGFYFYLTDGEGKALEGLEWAPDDPVPAEDPSIVTTALPKGYNDQPYVWLDVRNPSGKYPWENPSASAFRLLARGGTPPYTWSVESLPEGLVLDADEGEIRGRTTQLGDHTVKVTVRDSGKSARTATKEFVLSIAPRPTEEWWEHSTRVGGLRHGGPPSPTLWLYDHVEEQIDYMKRIGYSWQAFTNFAQWEFGPDGSMVINSLPEALRYRDALREAGIRFAQYMSFKDFRDRAPNYKAHADNMHEALERMMRQNEPVLWIFDEMYGRQFRPADQVTVEFDALYSLIRTIDPHCLITVNGNTRARDYECGDLDILFVHGAFQQDAYWGYWTPDPLFHNNPKYLPADSWKLPWDGYLDPQEWCRTLVTQLAEPSNLEALHGIQIDPTPVLLPERNTVEMFRAMADWMEPRQHTILGTRPLEVPPADWGYAVRQPSNGRIYLHILKNPLGKVGLHERSYIDLAPVAMTVRTATVVPSGKALPVVQEGDRVSIDVRGLEIDPVDTIIQLDGVDNDS